MQMTVNVNERGTYAHVGFINNNCLIMCLRNVCARLKNTDFLVLRHILNFIRRTKYRTFSTHC